MRLSVNLCTNSNAGIEIDRGSSANASLIWDETNDKWVFSSDGTTYYGNC
jgi:hypothetical protein